MNAEIIIEPIQIPPDAEFSRVFNTNNHWPGGVRPADYDWRLGLTNTKHWIDALKPNHFKIKIDSPVHMRWLHEANQIGRQTGRFPEAFRDELADLLAFISNNTTPDLFANRKLFVRCNNVSLKHGQHGVGPYTSMQQMIESAVTCRAGHSPFDTVSQQKPQELCFYLIEWIDLNPDQEFRVFVHNNRLTCISQQHCYRPNKTLLASQTRDETIKVWVSMMHKFWETSIRPHISSVPDFSYTIDMAIVINDNKQMIPYFIELNCFGKEYAAGSALFHWIADENKLNAADESNNTPKAAIYFRFGI